MPAWTLKSTCRRVVSVWVPLALACAFLLSACDQSGPPVRFVVPDDFRGEFRIVEREDADEVPVRSGQYVYDIPRTGTLFVRRALGFRRWHDESACFFSGRPLSIGSRSMHASDPEATWVAGTA